MKRGVGVGGAVTQGGGRYAPLPWAILSLSLRDGKWSLLISAIMRSAAESVADLFSCVSRAFRLCFERYDQEIILHDKPWIAEPGHCSERREALWVCREVAGWLESSAPRGRVPALGP